MSSPPSEPPELPSKPREFRLALYAKLALSLAYGVAFLLLLISSNFSSYNIGRTVGLVTGWTVVAGIFGYGAYRIAGRRNAAASIVFTVVLGLVVLGHVASVVHTAGQRAQATSSMNALINQKEQAKQLYAETGDANAFSASAQQLVADTAGRLNDLAAKSTGEQKQFFEIMAGFMDESQAVLADWTAAFEEVSAERVLDFSRLDSQEEYDYQIGTVENYHAQTQRYDAFFKAMMPELRMRLAAMGPDSKLAEEALIGAGSKHNDQAPIFHPLMQAHLDYADAMLGLLQLLYRNHDEWIWNEGQVQFEQDIPLAEFNVFVEQLLHAEERINRLAPELVEQS